jgi:hypothetical protein
LAITGFLVSSRPPSLWLAMFDHGAIAGDRGMSIAAADPCRHFTAAGCIGYGRYAVLPAYRPYSVDTPATDIDDLTG